MLNGRARKKLKIILAILATKKTNQIQTGDNHCRVQYLEKLIKVQNPVKESLFQRSKRSFSSNDGIWFNRAFGCGQLTSTWLVFVSVDLRLEMSKNLARASSLKFIYLNIFLIHLSSLKQETNRPLSQFYSSSPQNQLDVQCKEMYVSSCTYVGYVCYNKLLLYDFLFELWEAFFLLEQKNIRKFCCSFLLMQLVLLVSTEVNAFLKFQHPFSLNSFLFSCFTSKSQSYLYKWLIPALLYLTGGLKPAAHEPSSANFSRVRLIFARISSHEAVRKMCMYCA